VGMVEIPADGISLTPSPSPEGRGEMYGGKWFANHLPEDRI